MPNREYSKIFFESIAHAMGLAQAPDKPSDRSMDQDDVTDAIDRLTHRRLVKNGNSLAFEIAAQMATGDFVSPQARTEAAKALSEMIADQPDAATRGLAHDLAYGAVMDMNTYWPKDDFSDHPSLPSLRAILAADPSIAGAVEEGVYDAITGRTDGEELRSTIGTLILEMLPKPTERKARRRRERVPAASNLA